MKTGRVNPNGCVIKQNNTIPLQAEKTEKHINWEQQKQMKSSLKAKQGRVPNVIHLYAYF